ncbi:MAG TPA: acyl-CoA dehydrogenase family protein [Caulobacteraceae bacterium]
MLPFRPRDRLDTHVVVNQPPPLPDYNAFADDPLMRPARLAGDAHAEDRAHLIAFGDRCGSLEAREWGALANENPPRLKSFDRYGRRLDEVEFHPAYHALMDLGLSHGVASRAWTRPGAGHTQHGALMMLMTQADSGVTCPMSMTYAVVPALRASAWASAEWEPRVLVAGYDGRFLPASDKTGATMGMAMTEKQGGSDVRANSTRAVSVGGDEVELAGHKWFCSAPMSDALLTLAWEDAGLSCFLVPRWRPDGERNAIEIERLKDKLGDRSNASAEIEYHGAWARRVGGAGRGVATIIQMVQHTRFDCVLGAAGVMRRALTEALWHCAHRTAFQRRLIDQPLMALTLADVAIEVEAAMALAFRLGGALDDGGEPDASAFARLAIPAAKYWITKRCTGAVNECLEAHGGVGYVEETPMPRLFRQAPLNAIWEGSGNVIALDMRRALTREPAALEAVAGELASVAGVYAGLDAFAGRIVAACRAPGEEIAMRGLVERLALALQAAALIKTAPGFVADAFVRLRIDRPAMQYGASGGIDTRAILGRAMIGGGGTVAHA